MEAFDIWTDSDVADVAGDRPRLPAGWADPAGPGIDVRTWPRSPRTGQPMTHCFTLRLPEAYRRRGPDLVAVSVFQWEDDLYFKDPLPEVVETLAGHVDVERPEHPFWAELARSRPHPQLQVADDGVCSLFAMLWLNEAELAGPRTARPTAAPQFADGERDCTAVRRRYGLYGSLWLVPRVADPNVGVAPVRFPEDGDVYLDLPDRFDTFHCEHLGGTGMCPDGTRDGLSPWYIEVSRLGGINYGGDQDIALDLDGTAFLGDMSSAVVIPGDA